MILGAAPTLFEHSLSSVDTQRAPSCCVRALRRSDSSCDCPTRPASPASPNPTRPNTTPSASCEPRSREHPLTPESLCPQNVPHRPSIPTDIDLQTQPLNRELSMARFTARIPTHDDPQARISRLRYTSRNHGGPQGLALGIGRTDGRVVTAVIVRIWPLRALRARPARVVYIVRNPCESFGVRWRPWRTLGVPGRGAAAVKAEKGPRCCDADGLHRVPEETRKGKGSRYIHIAVILPLYDSTRMWCRPPREKEDSCSYPLCLLGR